MKVDDFWQDAQVDRIEDLSPTVRSLLLRPAGGSRPWTVGSHLRVQVRIDGRDEVRSYSVVGLPGDDLRDGPQQGGYRIAVKRAEPGRGGSRHLWALRAGDTLRFAGPDNHFALPADPAQQAPHTLLVAGGIGITAIGGMALTLAGRGASLRLCYAARERAELVFAERLRAALGDRMQTYVDADGERLDIATEMAALPPAGQLFICGPAPLLQAAQTAWAAAGRPPAKLRFETFGASGHQPNQPFWVRLPRHGLRLEVPADRSLLDVLGEHGVEVLNNCRRGECGLCALDVHELQGTLDHRDVFFSAAQKSANRQLCACVSRVNGGGIVIDSAWRARAAPYPPSPETS